MDVLELLSDAQVKFQCNIFSATFGSYLPLFTFYLLQISEILSGQCPLTVKLAVGVHIMYVQLQLSAKNEFGLLKNQNLRAQSIVQAQAAPPTTAIINHPKIYSSATTTLPASQSNVHSITSDSSFETQSRHGSAAGTTFNETTCRQSLPHHPSPRHSRHPTIPVIENFAPALTCTQPSCPLPAATPVCTPDIISGQQSTTPASSIKPVCILVR